MKAVQVIAVVTMGLLGGCGLDETSLEETAKKGPGTLDKAERRQLASRVRSHFTARGIGPITTPTIPGSLARQQALVALGQALLFDKILSDNQDISCMTCHPPAVGTDDDRTLSSGVRGTGLGVSRAGGIDIPRNAPPLFNLHMADSLFWDGRLERLPDGSYRSPAGAQLTSQMTSVFEFGALSAIAMFPVTNRDEMREHTLDGRFDDLTAIADDDFTAIWEGLMKRLRAIPRYREMFGDAYPDWPGSRTNRIDTMTFAHASNAMAAFMAVKFVSKDSPWDAFVAGDDMAFKKIEDLTRNTSTEIMERDIFLGAERFMQTCANCHNGPLLSDNRYHNTALAQIGPGVGDGIYGDDDWGRARVVSDADPHARCGNEGTPSSCRYAFRTMPLRNIALTAPYGHAGEFGHAGNDEAFGTDLRNDIEDLRTFIAHYAVDPATNLRAYDPSPIDARIRDRIVDNYDDIVAHIDPLFANGSPVTLDDVDNLTAFMVAQTSVALVGAGVESGTSARFALCGVIPASVPSGLTLDADAGDEDDCRPDGKHNDDWYH